MSAALGARSDSGSSDEFASVGEELSQDSLASLGRTASAIRAVEPDVLAPSRPVETQPDLVSVSLCESPRRSGELRYVEMPTAADEVRSCM